MNLHIVISGGLYKNGGGIDTWASYFIPNIAKYFDKIYIYCTKPLPNRKKMIQVFDSNKVEVLRVSEPNSHLFIKKAPQLIIEKYKKYDIILSIGTLISGWVAYRIKAKIGNANIAGWIRGIPHKEKIETKGVLKSYFYRYLEKRFVKRMDILIANGFDTAKYYRNFSPSSRIFVVPNAVDVSRFASIKIPIFVDPIKVGFYGRFVKAKGFEYFLKLIENRKLKDFFLIRAWGWSQSQDFHKKEWYMGAYNAYESQRVLNKSDIILLLNNSKGASGGGISHLLLEAMAAGRLIIAWDNAIHRQILNKSNSILVKEGDVESLVSILFKIRNSSNKQDYIKLCLNAKKDSARFSIDEHISKFLNSLRVAGWF